MTPIDVLETTVHLDALGEVPGWAAPTGKVSLNTVNGGAPTSTAPPPKVVATKEAVRVSRSNCSFLVWNQVGALMEPSRVKLRGWENPDQLPLPVGSLALTLHQYVVPEIRFACAVNLITSPAGKGSLAPGLVRSVKPGLKVPATSEMSSAERARE
jgi:hypothetical protein